MKIQHDHPSGVQDAGRAEPVATVGLQPAQAARGGVDAGDLPALSAETRLFGQAVDAASTAPEIRQEVVDRARARLAAGEIGNDPGRLADRLIDSLLAK
jgi:hypothetical protein